MKRFAVILVLTIFFNLLSAQINKYGTPLSKSYGTQVTHTSENNWCITKDKFGVIYFGNDDNLVLRFDGSKWSIIPLSPENETVVRSLGSDENGIIYVGGINELGYIEPDISGKRVYNSLTNRISGAKDITSDFIDSASVIASSPAKRTIGEVKSIIVKDSTVYFLTTGSLILYDITNDSLRYVNLRSLGYRYFERMVLIENKIIIANNVKGLYELKNNKLVMLPGGDFFKFKMCLTILPYQTNKLLIATFDKGYFLYDYSTGKIDSSFIEREMYRKLKGLWTLSGVKLSTGEFIFGTTTDGAYVFDKNGKYISHWTSSNTEMQDNAVTAMYSDPASSSELWISTAGFITKVYVNLPFTQFSEKSGLKGGVNEFCSFNGSVYVGTDQGLFKSITDKEGNRTFMQFNHINSQIFPLQVADISNETYLLAGSLIGVYQIDRNGKLSLLPFTKSPVRSIYQSKVNKNRFFIGLNNTAVLILDYKSGKWNVLADLKVLGGLAIKFCELDNGDIFVLTNYQDFIFRIPANDTIPVKYTPEKGIPTSGLSYLCEDNGSLIVSTNEGLMTLNRETDKWEPCDNLTGGYTKNKITESYYRDPEGDLWISTHEDRYYDIMFSQGKDTLLKFKSGALALLPDVRCIYLNSIEDRVWLTKSQSIFIIDKDKMKRKLPEIQTLLTKILVAVHGKDSLVMNETFYKQGENGRRYPVSSFTGQKTPEFHYSFNSPSFSWTTPYMIQEEDIMYSYMLEGFDNTWSKWDKISYKDYTNLSFGKYTFRVKARTYTNVESKAAEYTFNILKPWYLTPWMIFLYLIAAALSIFGIISAYTKRLKNENIRLEGIVAERTAVVVKQKEELESSIHYASRIQMALLPSQKILSENIKNYFVLFKPRDIVSGDFYWMTKKGDRLYVVAADCTGHGVPGAFMSLLGMSFLDEIIDKEFAPRADFILYELRLHVMDSLKQMGTDDEAKDGMDIALLVIDFKTQRIEFSGAYNPCFKVRKLSENETSKYAEDSAERPDGTMTNGEYLLETIFASKMPIGISSRMDENFVFDDWALEKDTSYYLFSDGYIDQFGGDRGRKFMKKNFKKLLLEIQDYPMSRQKELLDKNLRDWMGQTPQIDDILVMGIRT